MRRPALLPSAVALAAALVAPPAGPLHAQPAAPAGGHAAHGAAPAGAAPDVGRVEFPTSAAPAAHAEFTRGVALLHNFLYPEAVAAFRRARALDSADVLSTSFEALAWTYPVWDVQDTAKARAALRTIAPTRAERLAKARTPRERGWMDAVEALYDEGVPAKAARDTAFGRAMAALHAADPGDPEAAALYALSLLGLNQGQREPAAYAHAEAVADTVLRARPRHPGALHYKIHAVDAPADAARGLAAARLYGEVAPGAHHALHMTSHIYIARGMWDDVVAMNRRAVAAAAPRLSGHYAEWLVYGLLQQGRPGEARRWVDSAVALARSAAAPRDAGMLPVVLAAPWVVDAEAWDDPLARLRPDTAGLQGVRTRADFLVGYAAARRAVRPAGGAPGGRAADRALADAMLARMTSRLAALRAGGPAAPAGARAGALDEAEVTTDVLRAELLAGAGRVDSAVGVLRAAAARWEALPFDFGPPGVLKPPRERAAELLLAARHRPAESLAQADSAERMTPGRAQLLLVRARALAALGRRAEARRAYAALDGAWHAAEAGFGPRARARAESGALARVAARP